MDQYEIPIAPLSVAFDDGETFTENDNVPIERFIIKWPHLKHSQQQVNRLLGNGLRTMKLRDKGYTDIIVIALSSGISGSYQSATQAGEMVEGVNVHTFDSKLAAMIEGSYTIYAKELIDKGFTPEVIIEELKEIREQAGAYLIVDDLKNLQKADV